MCYEKITVHVLMTVIFIVILFPVTIKASEAIVAGNSIENTTVTIPANEIRWVEIISTDITFPATTSKSWACAVNMSGRLDQRYDVNKLPYINIYYGITIDKNIEELNPDDKLQCSEQNSPPLPYASRLDYVFICPINIKTTINKIPTHHKISLVAKCQGNRDEICNTPPSIPTQGSTREPYIEYRDAYIYNPRMTVVCSENLETPPLPHRW